MTTPKEQGDLSEAEKFLETLNLSNDENAEPGTIGNTDDIMSYLDGLSNDEKAGFKQELEPTPSINASNEKKDIKTKDEKPSENIPSKDTGKEGHSNNAGTGSSLFGDWGKSFIQQAREAVNQTGFADVTLEGLGSNLRNLTSQVIDIVAPPIAEHEKVEVWFTHDMISYTGIDALVYRSFDRVMEDTETGKVVVHEAGRLLEKQDGNVLPNLNLCEEGIEQGAKLAKANIDALIKKHNKSENESKASQSTEAASSGITSPVFMALQPAKVVMASPESKLNIPPNEHVVVVVVLIDPTHNLNFITHSQSIPLTWFNEPSSWVEDQLKGVLRLAFTIIAQDYVWTRMSETPSTTVAPVAPVEATKAAEAAKVPEKSNATTTAPTAPAAAIEPAA